MHTYTRCNSPWVVNDWLVVAIVIVMRDWFLIMLKLLTARSIVGATVRIDMQRGQVQ